jgi:tmRNA-binding protein
MIGFLVFCVFFWTVTFGQEEAGKQVVFKAICENGIECTVKLDCTLNISAMDEGIELIDDFSLADCTKIEVLDLGFNEISEISKNAFQDQRNLRKLYLDNNQIKILQPGVFDPLTSLTELYLYNNSIKVIDDSLFVKNVKLEELHLNQNKIVAVGPKAFKKLSQLNYLTLYGNPCMHPDIVFGWNKNPEELGIFSYSGSDFKKWKNKNNTCVSSYRSILRQNRAKSSKSLTIKIASNNFNITLVLIL